MHSYTNCKPGTNFCYVASRLKGKDAFHAGVGTHYVTSDKVHNLIIII